MDEPSSIRTEFKMRLNRAVLVAALVLILLIAGLAVYYEVTLAQANSGFVTGTTVDTQLTKPVCYDTGAGDIQLRVVSDFIGFPIHGESVNAEYMTPTCIGFGPNTPQAVYLDNFSAGSGGWLTPVYPPNAPSPGALNFTIANQGKVYNFSEPVPPIGGECVTLHVPSGSVTARTVMNANGSYCA
jgi:hypothetical protein